MEEQLSSSSAADSPQRCCSCNQARPLVSPTLKEALIRVAKVTGKIKTKSSTYVCVLQACY